MGFKDYDKYLPKDIFLDRRAKKDIGNHYSIDTNVITHALGLWRIYNINIKPIDVIKWFNKGTITIYPQIFGELFSLLRRKGYTEKAREFLSGKNIRLLYSDILDKQNWEKTLERLNPSLTKALLKHVEEREIDSEDVSLMVMSNYENATIVSFDSTINLLSFKYGINCYDTRYKTKLPLDFTSPWKELNQKFNQV